MKHVLALFTLLLAASPAWAQPDPAAQDPGYYVTTSVGSHHFAERSPGRRYNEFNPGIGLEVYQAPFATIFGDMPVRTFLSAGYYHNSISKPSLYATGGLETCKSLDDDWGLCGGMQAGAVTGYYYTVTPAAIGYLKLQYDDLYFKTGLIPPVSGGSHGDVPATLLFQFGYKFN